MSSDMHDDRLHAFAAHLVRDVRHGQRAVDRLAAGHRDRVVVEDLVGDVDLGRDRLADRQRAGMEIGAVAEVLEHVLRFGERRLAAPGHAFAAHLREGVGAAVHPRDHVVAADAAERARAFRHRGRGVVRAARRSSARRAGSSRAATRVRVPSPRSSACATSIASLLKKRARRLAITRAMLAGVSSFVLGRIQSPASSYLPTTDGRVRPSAPFQLYICSFICDSMKQRFSSTTMMSSSPRAKARDAERLQRPGHADLVDADADVGRGACVDAEVLERLQHVEVALAGGDDAEARLRRIDDDAVDAGWRARTRTRRLHRVLVQAHFLVQRRIGPADVEAAERQLEVFGRTMSS